MTANRATAVSRFVSSVPPSDSISCRISPPAEGRMGTTRLLHSHDHGGPAIEAARLFTRVVVLRPFLAVAHDVQPIGADAAARQVVAHRGRPALAEREVVLGRADVAGVAFDRD